MKALPAVEDYTCMCVMTHDTYGEISRRNKPFCGSNESLAIQMI